jgi:hypothetical protein
VISNQKRSLTPIFCKQAGDPSVHPGLSDIRLLMADI